MISQALHIFRQALHIFRKDMRYLRVPVALYLALAALFAWTGAGSPLESLAEALLALAAINLIARLIHAETIPGDRQFWITRPYNWRSLLVAKLLFIAVFICAPVAVARLATLALLGYPLAAAIWPLLWSQLLLFIVAATMAALAALTPGLVEFSFSLLGLALFGAIVVQIAPAILFARFHIQDFFWPDSIEWIRQSIVGVIVIAAAAWMLLRQYRDRATRASRLFAGGAALIATFLYFAIPPAAGLLAQGLLSPERSPNIQAAPDYAIKSKMPPRTQKDASMGIMPAPLAFRLVGLPDNSEIRPDQARISIDWPDGEAWRGLVNLGGGVSQGGVAVLRGTAVMNALFFDRLRNTPATLRATLYLTIFGRPQSTTIPFAPKPANVQDGLQCYSGLQGAVFNNNFGAYYCRSFFGWPARLVSVSAGRDNEDFTKIVSYAPFPSGVSLNSSESRYTTLAWDDEKQPASVTVTTKRPLAHFHTTFEAVGVRLEDFISR
jgi:hypothetical protein